MHAPFAMRTRDAPFVPGHGMQMIYNGPKSKGAASPKGKRPKNERGEGMEYLTSGQMAKANRISEKALRVYQEKGILIPKYVDEATGRRYYDIQQSTKLDMILQLQQIGFSLNEISRIDELKDMGYLQQEAVERLEAIKEQQRELAIARQAAEGLVESCATYLDKPIIDQIMLEMLPVRHIVKFKVPDPKKLRAGASSSTAEQWEWAMRHARQEVYDRGYPHSLFHDLGVLIPKDSVEEREPSKEHIFAFVNESFGACFEDSEPLPGGEHLTLYLDRAYDDAGQELDTDRLIRMADYAHKKHLELAGDVFGEVLCRYPRFFNIGENLLYRFCAPVRPAR